MILQVLSVFGVGVVIILILILRFLWVHRNKYFGEDNRNSHFASSCKNFPVFHNEKAGPMKRKLFECLQSMESAVPEMKKKNEIRILEIGVGAGANFQFYPPNTSLVVVDPNPFFKPYMEENLAHWPHVKIEQFLVCGAEDMKDVPDHSVDAVVSTLVMCSVPELQQVFKEIKRVLVPGGKFLFMEHVIDDKLSWMKLAQKFLGMTGIFQFLLDGCRPDADIELIVKKGGFASVECTRFRMDTSEVEAAMWTIWMLEPQLYGIATTCI